jgi:hypothetical protein
MRYNVFIIAKEFREHTGVTFKLFHPDDLPEEVYEEMIPAELDRADPYLRSVAEETFSEDEVGILRDWFTQEWAGGAFKTQPADPVKANAMGVGALPVGGADGCILFSEYEDWPLSCRVHAYYDLEDAEDGPYVRNPDLAYLTIARNDAGQVVVKLPPF